MLQSQLFPKTSKEAPKGAQSKNHEYLVRGGFIDQLMSGSWTLLPLGLRVVSKINQVIREEMNAIGGEELAMPLLHPKEIWNETERWEKAKDVMYQLKDSHEREYALSFTHEEIVMDLLRKHVSSYKDLPVYIYQFSTKFRNEPRATSGILRGREFLMKDLYSAHVSEEDLMAYYELAKEAYVKIFKRLGLKVKVAEASGGVFTSHRTHEFQVLSDVGEDTIYFCDKCEGYAQNKEVFDYKIGDACPVCGRGKIVEARSIEVGNIFPLGTMYSEKMKAFFTDKDGSKKPIWFGSYGIGPTRVMGTLVEVYHDDKGIVWPELLAPYKIHLIEIQNSKIKDQNDSSKFKDVAREVYENLTKAGVEVLWDEREDVTPGQKFADADLLGIPFRVVVSSKSLSLGGFELKKRNEEESKIVTEKDLLSL